MKRKFLSLGIALLIFIVVGPPIRAQSGITGNLTASSTDCTATNACLILSVPANVGGATIQLSGTFSATTQFEASGDPLSVSVASATWVAISATPSNSTTTATSATAAGVWQVNLSGYRRIRVRVSTYASGTVAAAINLSTASARAGGGGGGGGNPASPVNSVQFNNSGSFGGSSNFTYLPSTNGVNVTQSANSTNGFTDTLGTGITGAAGYYATADSAESQTNSPFVLHDVSLNDLWGVQSDGSMKSLPTKDTSPIAVWKVVGATGLQTAPLVEANYQGTGTNSSQVVFRGSGLGTLFAGSPALVNFESQALNPWNTIWTDTSKPAAFLAMYYNVDHPELVYSPDGVNFVGAVAFQNDGRVQIESPFAGAGKVEILGNLMPEPGSPTSLGVAGRGMSALYLGGASVGKLAISTTAPTILAAGCGAAGASITVNNGTAAFTVNVGTTNSGTCTITMPAATTDWNCGATDITTTSTLVSMTKSVPGGTPATQITLQNYTDVSATHAWVDSDKIQVRCVAE
jgi:hypothetical protein